MNNLDDYILSLENADLKFTEQEWREWIKHENEDLAEQVENFAKMTESDIDYVIERLTNDGFII